MAGTLTLPRSGGPFAAALLITGAGAQDRDETVVGHKPFLVLSDFLTRRGVAVLRVDDRGVGGSGGQQSAMATSADFATDVASGVEYLQRRREIDPARIGLIGHSEGANVAAIVAAARSDIRFVVMLAGTGLRGDEVMYQQAASLGRLRKTSEELLAWDRSVRERVYALLEAENGTIDVGRRGALVAAAPPAPGGDPQSGHVLAEALLKEGSVPWFRYFLAYDPAPTLAKVKVPVLALNGANDVQLPWRENVQAIRRALESGGNADVTVMNLPGLNHLFQTSASGDPAEYGRIEETISPRVLELVGDWTLMRTRR